LQRGEAIAEALQRPAAIHGAARQSFRRAAKAKYSASLPASDVEALEITTNEAPAETFAMAQC
jgi:hypothetical protein